MPVDGMLSKDRSARSRARAEWAADDDNPFVWCFALRAGWLEKGYSHDP
jgi:hypothetical protein